MIWCKKFREVTTMCLVYFAIEWELHFEPFSMAVSVVSHLQFVFVNMCEEYERIWLLQKRRKQFAESFGIKLNAAIAAVAAV